MMIQALGDNGAIESTYTIDSSGKATHHRGGTCGVVPGAPPEFNAANGQRMRQGGIVIGPRTTKAEDPENKADSGESERKGTGEGTAKKPKEMPKNAQGTFGRETSVNNTLRSVILTTNQTLMHRHLERPSRATFDVGSSKRNRAGGHEAWKLAATRRE
jgi:hypothetical protein